MISRRTTIAIADAYVERFTHGTPTIESDSLYDFLFEHDFGRWFLDRVRENATPRELKEFIMHLHTGQPIYDTDGSGVIWEVKGEGQNLLEQLAASIARWFASLLGKTESIENSISVSFWSKRVKIGENHVSQRFVALMDKLVDNLELDGYTLRKDGHLLFNEGDILDTDEVAGVLQTLHEKLDLGNRPVALQALESSGQAWLNKKWEDCVHNARKFLESILQEIANSLSLKYHGKELAREIYEWPGKVREYLHREKVVDEMEREALKEDYGFLSKVGSHPYLASSEQARFLRHHALSLAQFVMLTYQGFVDKNPPPKLAT
ncbi:MAG TPA: hypothetical protein VKE94_05035 [Gemmataceae bacterium]|nr:hypothetical protein [Gemmataceae bacterium]